MPEAGADKYSRGVLGVITGSNDYPGAAVLGVEGALRTGVGMVRYLGPEVPTSLVLQRRPEAVTADGRVQAWLIGSGMDASKRAPEVLAQLKHALGQGVPVVLDAGALDLIGASSGPVVITPHFGELAKLMSTPDRSVTRTEIAADPPRWARRAAEQTGATVFLKGNVTHIARPSGEVLPVQAGPPWVATAGAGDVLGGVLGALVATHFDQVMGDESALLALAATAALVHAGAGMRASHGGPVLALEIAEHVQATIADLLSPSA